MIKGWVESDGYRFYFDPVYGTMAKGSVTIEGLEYYFDIQTGILN
jgi:glucan-binding YG repeat protein